MTFFHESSPLNEAWISLDLETTGLSSEADEIIEIGAIKFVGDKELEKFQSFVNPGRKLSDFIIDYTGIKQSDVNKAPTFGTIAPQLASFLGSTPIVGHNIGFDLGFLKAKGMQLINPTCDTWEMAYVLRPNAKSYGLGALANQINATHDNPHRAIDDAEATRALFIVLVRELFSLDGAMLAEMKRIAQRSNWNLKYLLNFVISSSTAETASRTPKRGNGMTDGLEDTKFSVAWEDTTALKARIKRDRPITPNEHLLQIEKSLIGSLLREESVFSKTISGYDERTQQVEMADAVTDTINTGGRLIVEAGTGVGKSMAYLLPAAIYAASNNRRVIISTNTLNLQDQLVTKDLPMVLTGMEKVPELADLDVKFTQLKGRSNYLCFNRLQALRNSPSVDDPQSRLLAKILKWLPATDTGDRSELNLGHRSASAPWDRLSAQGSRDCGSSNEYCFLKAARAKAAASHIVVVNHALLLSDVAMGGSVIPDYDVLIIDEAHHLEEEATRQLGFDIPQRGFDDYIQGLSGDRGIFNNVVAALRRSAAGQSRQKTVQEAVDESAVCIPRTREAVTHLFNGLTAMIFDGHLGKGRQHQEARVTTSSRSQPGWSELEIAWENVDLLLSRMSSNLTLVERSLDGLKDSNVPGYEGLFSEVSESLQRSVDLRNKLAEFFVKPQEKGIYWATKDPRTQDAVLHAAPLDVSETLDELLFSEKESVVLTSATLSTGGDFKHLVNRTGFNDAKHLLLGSPFDYEQAALVCVPSDMPQPNAEDYHRAVNWAVIRAAESTDGRAMSLFTSHASLRTCASAIRGPLKALGISVLAQGVDGTPQQLVSRFLNDPRTILLGTASFWEGVDLPGDSLKVLLVTRLPFNVPSEPVFASRSDQYEEPFNQYAVPQAVLKLRQGFGRLIRTKSDRGVAIILDQRILSRRYGKTFLKSLPPVNIDPCSMLELPAKIKEWFQD